MQRLTETAGAAYEAVQTAAVERLERACPAPPMGPAVQQVSVDGAMIPLRGKGKWAEVKTLAIGTVTGAPSAAPSAPAAPPDQAASVAVEPAVQTVALSYFSRKADHQTFSRLATVETHRRGVETAGVVCGVVDGADWCQQFFDLHRPDAIRILDFPHAASYLATIATAAFGQGTTAATAWLARQCEDLTKEHGTPESVVAAIREVLSTLPAGTEHETVTKALAYPEKRIDHLRYATFRAQGYPIGSGIVESANKTVVETRLKGAGMHWAPTHVNPMLALRTVACNDRWDEAWPQLVDHWRTQRRHRTTQRRHRQQKHHHQHHRREQYQDGEQHPPIPCRSSSPTEATTPPIEAAMHSLRAADATNGDSGPNSDPVPPLPPTPPSSCITTTTSATTSVSTSRGQEAVASECAMSLWGTAEDENGCRLAVCCRMAARARQVGPTWCRESGS